MATKQLPVLADSAPTQCLARVYVWELPVRISHWLIFLAIAVLSVTGWYMHSPFVISRAPGAFTMATMRFTHIVAGYVFLAAFILRLYWFFAGNYWASWRFFVPTEKRNWKSMGEMFKYYSFVRREPVRQVGHNALAGITYTIIFLIIGWECFSGLVLYSQVRWAPRLIDIQYIRMFHFLGMFALLAFAIHHVYSAVLVSIEERNGLMDSMFTGFKFVLDYELKEQELRRQILMRESLPARIGRWWATHNRKKGA
jgi:Ni/Fe-hydrogenase 1 B-type cytochrome subunit